MMAIPDAALAEWRACLSAALETVCGRSTSVRAGARLAMEQLSAHVYGTARKKLPAMKHASAAAFGQRQRGES